MNYRPPGKGTPSLVIRATIYLTIVVPLLVVVPEVRRGIGYVLLQVGTATFFGVGILLGLLILTGAKPPRDERGRLLLIGPSDAQRPDCPRIGLDRTARPEQSGGGLEAW